VPSRRSAASHASMRRERDEPASLGPSPVGRLALVEISTRSRRPLTARPSTSSEAPAEYTSAVSKSVTPASRQMSTSRRASAASVLPHAPNRGPLPPNVPAPNASAGTFSPDAPSRRYSITTS
jgi:hypothetical protein